MEKRQSNAAFARIAAGALSIGLFILLWHFGTNGTVLGKLMPGPLAVLGHFFRSFTAKIGPATVLGHIGWSLSRVLIAYSAASLAGVTLGLTMGWYRRVEAVFRPYFEMIRPIPPIAWIPMAIIWFGLGEMTVYFLIFLAAFSNVTMNAYAGAKAVDPTLVGAARMLGADDRQVFLTIVLPSSVPYIFAGLQIALSSSWATVVAAEMVRSSRGIGWVIISGMELNNMTQILSGIIGIGVIGFLLAVLMRYLEARLVGWKEGGQ